MVLFHTTGHYEQQVMQNAGRHLTCLYARGSRIVLTMMDVISALTATEQAD
jgi:hypothetical protein